MNSDLSNHRPPQSTSKPPFLDTPKNDELERFLNRISPEESSFTASKGDLSESQFLEIPLDKLRPPSTQPRSSFDSERLAELATSIENYGVLQPIIVASLGGGFYEIVAGERRFRASQKAGLKKIPCIVRTSSEHDHLEIALIENIQREDLNCFEEAECFFTLIDQHALTHDALAMRVGKSRAHITNSLRLLLLPKQVRDSVVSKDISAGHARALCSLNTAESQLKALSIIIEKKLSVRQTELLVKQLQKPAEPTPILKNRVSEDILYVCEQMKSYLGTKVKITGNAQKGRIEISYYTLEDFQRIYELVTKEQEISHER